MDRTSCSHWIRCTRQVESCSWAPHTCLRRVGDRDTWVIRLDTEDIRPSSVTDSVLESSAFQIRSNNSLNEPFWYYKVAAISVFHQPIFKYRYLTADRPEGEDDDDDEDETYPSLLEDLKYRLDDFIVIELYKAKAAIDQQAYSSLLATCRRGWSLQDKFVPPKNRKFYDEKVLKYLNKAWQAHPKFEEEKKEKAAAATDQGDLVRTLARTLKAHGSRQ